MDGQINGSRSLSLPLEKERLIRLRPFPCRSILIHRRGNQAGNRVGMKREELIRESSKSGEDEKG